MRLSKKILRNRVVRLLISRLAAQYIRLAYAGSRWSVLRGEIPKRWWDESKPFILAFWHGRMLMMPYCWNHKADVYMLVSEHPDGQLGAAAMARLGIKSVAGSSTRGGFKALRALLQTIRNGDCVAIAPDGPRGPRMRAGNGIINVARLSGAPIIPVAFSVTHGKVVSSWDRFLIACPFARGIMVWGEPIQVPRHADAGAVEDARKRVENALNAITAEADILSGRVPVEPERESAP